MHGQLFGRVQNTAFSCDQPVEVHCNHPVRVGIAHPTPRSGYQSKYRIFRCEAARHIRHLVLEAPDSLPHYGVVTPCIPNLFGLSEKELATMVPSATSPTPARLSRSDRMRDVEPGETLIRLTTFISRLTTRTTRATHLRARRCRNRIRLYEEILRHALAAPIAARLRRRPPDGDAGTCPRPEIGKSLTVFCRSACGLSARSLCEARLLRSTH